MASIQQLSPKVRCQSCSLPVGAGFFGTNQDGGENHEYCQLCFQIGVFTKPDLTMEEMIVLSIDHMVDELGFSEDSAMEIVHSVIPALKRWGVK